MQNPHAGSVIMFLDERKSITNHLSFRKKRIPSDHQQENPESLCNKAKSK